MLRTVQPSHAQRVNAPDQRKAEVDSRNQKAAAYSCRPVLFRRLRRAAGGARHPSLFVPFGLCGRRSLIRSQGMHFSGACGLCAVRQHGRDRPQIGRDRPD